MHELGITRNIVSIVAEHAGGRQVKRVVLEIGTLAGVMPEAIAFCFDVVAAGTLVEGALLHIRRIEARARCRVCGAEFVQETLLTTCGCGSNRLERLSGAELNIKEYEIDPASDAAQGSRSKTADRPASGIPAQGEGNV